MADVMADQRQDLCRSARRPIGVQIAAGLLYGHVLGRRLQDSRAQTIGKAKPERLGSVP